jgi:EAL domain-containing protein (putative c-di-GMP-specific phosphodiesterase class I)/GGDEF domain-containing protein
MPMTLTHEDARLDALYQLNLLDTPPTEAFDRITRMAAQLFNLPISAVSLTDRDRQWFKSRVGVEHTSIPREQAPCGAIADANEFLVIPDLLDNPCYANSTLAETGVRFYAGAPLTTRDGFSLGALCVLGTEPRTITADEQAALTDLAGIVMSQIELQHAFGRIDPVSGLPSRTQFLDDVNDLARDHPGQERLAVLVDLARNSEVDHGMRVMGPTYIDDMVREGARLLRGALSAKQTAYHVAGTQFAFLAPEGSDKVGFVSELRPIIQRLGEQSSGRFVMTIAVGVAPFILRANSAADALRSAYGAAQDARAAGRSVNVYSTSKDAVYQRRFTLLNDFGRALEQPDELRLVFQPRVDLATGKCIGAEALLRWTHPELGAVSPGEFIEIIEQTAFARPTTAWVLDGAIRQLSAWKGAGLPCQVSVNVSAVNLRESDFVDKVQSALRQYEVSPDALELEITESAVMTDAGQAFNTLERLSEAGIALAIDDFGTGYSSLSYLQRLPAKVVKIDRSFIMDLSSRDERAVTLVRSMIRLSHEMGYRVVAEGVETVEAMELLSAMGCEEAQGYLFSRPLEMADFEQILRLGGVLKP